MRLIDADGLINDIKRTIDFSVSDEHSVYSDIMELINDADSWNIGHGHWEVPDRKTLPYKYCCSWCGLFSLDNFDYCPNCGAKMEETGVDT